MAGGRSGRGAVRVELLLLGVALALRLAWAGLAPTELRLDHVFNDATARGLAAGRGFTASLEPPYDPAVFRTPGYSAFVALVYAVCGPSVRAVFVVQALLDTLACALVGHAAARRLGPRAGRVALLLAATYPFTIHAVGRLSAETPLVLFAVLATWLADRLDARSPVRDVALLGVVTAALVWTKPVFLPMPLALVAVERLRGRAWRTAAARGALVALVAGALFAPWLVRNARAFGRPVLAGELGLVVLHGTYDFAPDRDARIASGFDAEDAAVPAGADPAARYEATRLRFTDSPGALARDREHLHDALARMRAAPLRAALLDPLRRVPRLWVSTTFVGASPWIGRGAAVGCVAYLVLAGWGVCRLRGRLRELAAWWLVPVVLTGAYALLHAEARYTLPARATLLLCGAAALAAPRNTGRPGPPDTISP